MEEIEIYKHKAVCLARGFDAKRLQVELDALTTKSEWIERVNGVWHAIPMRSYQGGTTPLHISHMGKNLTASSTEFQDTKWMDCCPHLKEIIHALGPEVFKIRFMKMDAHSTLHDHTDNFPHKNIVRLHLGVRSHPLVTMTVDGKTWHIDEGELWFANVKRVHSVQNPSSIDRVHVVFDIKWSDRLEELFQQALMRSDSIID